MSEAKKSSKDAEQLTLFPADSLARTYPLQTAEEKEFMAKGLDSGKSFPVLFAKYDRNTSSWKTSQICLDGALESFSETWPRQGMTRNGFAYQLPKLEPITSGIESGYLPTPSATDCQRGIGTDVKLLQGGATHRMTGNKNRIQVTLDKYVTMFPTPRAFMHKDSSTDRGKSNLGEVVGGKLNPMWVEWLMGLPQGWTDLNCLETAKSFRLSSGSAKECLNVKKTNYVASKDVAGHNK